MKSGLNARIPYALLTAVTLVLSASCGGGQTQAPTDSQNAAAVVESPSQASEQPASEATPPEEAPSAAVSDYETPLVVSMNVMNAEKNGRHVRNEIIAEKFNMTFDYIPVNWADWNEKIRTWIATDDAPDLIWWDLKGQQAQEYSSWAEQGAFHPFLPEYFANRPNLKDVYDSSPSINALSVDGQLYSWPSMRDNLPEAQSCYTSHWSYRRDWAKAVGLYKEGDIYTWDEWLELTRAILREDPGKNGASNAGLVMPNWGFPHAAVLFPGPPAAEGNETASYIKDDSGKYIWPPATDAYKEGVKITYDMYQEGLIYKDNILFQGTEQEDMVKAGLAFATYNVTGSLNNFTDTMLQDGVITNREDWGIAIVSSYDGNWYMTQTEDYWTVTAMNHSLDDEKIDRILDFWEYLMTTEGRRMRLWGKEGVDFEVTGDAVNDIKLLWDYDDAAQMYIDPYLNIAEFNEANGAENNKTATIIAPGQSEYQYNEMKRLFDTMASGQLPVVIKKFDYDVSFSVYPNKGKYGSFGSEVKERLIALIAQPGIDIETEWDKFVQEMTPRVQLVLDELNSN
ncbi:MAG: hypothetical protein LBB94_05575 [Clostridiales bacterium]|jgi:putative aldouronate transport system substrate-binding protein|nr:hypothetical protein [Clostridiales bacterium]